MKPLIFPEHVPAFYRLLAPTTTLTEFEPVALLAMRLALLVVYIFDPGERCAARDAAEASRVVYIAFAVIHTLELIICDSFPALGADLARSLGEALLALQEFGTLHMSYIPEADTAAIATEALSVKLHPCEVRHITAAYLVLDWAVATGAYWVVGLEAALAQEVASLLVVFVPFGVVSCVG